MHIAPSSLAIAVAGIVTVAAGCAPSARGRVRTATGDAIETTIGPMQEAALQRAERELRCPMTDLAIEALGSGGYRVDGCGQTITYACATSRDEPYLCVTQERTGPAPGIRPQWTDEDLQRWLAAMHDDVLACAPSAPDPMPLQLTFRTDGTVHRSGRLPHDMREAVCVDAALSRQRLHGTVVEGRTAVLEFRRSRRGQVAPPRAETPHDETPRETPPAARGARMAPGPAARAVIDARAATILACVTSELLPMQLSWSSTGALDVLLRGEHSGGTAEACVRAIVQRLSIPAPVTPGTTSHTIARPRQRAQP